jgi:hypothetical protein
LEGHQHSVTFETVLHLFITAPQTLHNLNIVSRIGHSSFARAGEQRTLLNG